MTPAAGQHAILPFRLAATPALLLAAALVLAWVGVHALRRRTASRWRKGLFLAAGPAVGFLALGFMVEYHKTILPLIRPGRTADEIHAEAAAAMAKVVERTNFSKPIYEAAARRTLEFKGHLSHPVGMAVHDDGGYRAQPLRPGVVFTVDPQMWVPEEKVYIRCEDTVAVTPDGIENLTALAPLDLAAVEAAMREGKGL